MKVNEQIAQVRHELACLKGIREQTMRRMHYETVYDLVVKSGLPYNLVQDSRDNLGKFTRNYRYRFTSDFCSKASLYIQETEAGRQHRSMGEAFDALQRVLEEHLKSLESANEH